jgi:hypothetical protein
MEIKAKGKYPASDLSNFAGHKFVLRGFEIASMEGLLQGLKFKEPALQAEIFKLIGFAAKKRGSNKNWQITQTLWFQGVPIARESEEYQQLLTEAYNALFENKNFQEALRASGDEALSHNMGRTDARETVLTRGEFINQLYRLRKLL